MSANTGVCLASWLPTPSYVLHRWQNETERSTYTGDPGTLNLTQPLLRDYLHDFSLETNGIWRSFFAVTFLRTDQWEEDSTRLSFSLSVVTSAQMESFDLSNNDLKRFKNIQNKGKVNYDYYLLIISADWPCLHGIAIFPLQLGGYWPPFKNP